MKEQPIATSHDPEIIELDNYSDLADVFFNVDHLRMWRVYLGFLGAEDVEWEKTEYFKVERNSNILRRDVEYDSDVSGVQSWNWLFEVLTSLDMYEKGLSIAFEDDQRVFMIIHFKK